VLRAVSLTECIFFCRLSDHAMSSGGRKNIEVWRSWKWKGHKSFVLRKRATNLLTQLSKYPQIKQISERSDEANNQWIDTSVLAIGPHCERVERFCSPAQPPSLHQTCLHTACRA
jgi:hypothetical protein